MMGVKAEKEKDKTISSKQYIDKILGPERKQVYKKEEFESTETRPLLTTRTLVSSGIILALVLGKLRALW